MHGIHLPEPLISTTMDAPTALPTALLPSQYLKYSGPVQACIYRIYWHCGEWPCDFLDPFELEYNHSLIKKISQAVNTALNCDISLCNMLELMVDDREIDSDRPIDEAACERAIEVMKLMREHHKAT